MPTISVKKTGDGSVTLFVEELNEHYHSVHGAINESMHVFIQNGLLYLARKNIRILEVGFGTGLNAILSLATAVENDLNVEYTSLETFPLSAAVVEELNYPSLLKEAYAPFFNTMHSMSWDQPEVLNSNFSLHKVHKSLQDFTTDERFDLIYFDAFAPEKQPELWENRVFEKIASLMVPGAILVTYCAKGAVKRAIKSTGLIVEALPGPPGKREMTRGTKH